MMRPVADPAPIEALVDQVVERPWHITPRPGWTVVPVEKGRHFEDDEAQRVAAAIDAEKIYAAVTEIGSRACYELPATEQALEALSDELAGRNVALLGPGLDWLILLTSEDYNLIAGPQAFVTACLGADVEDARATFRAFAADPWWEGRLLEVAERYG